MFEKILWAAGGAAVMYLALKQRARIETLVRDAIDRGEAKPATAAADDGPDAELALAPGVYERGIVPPGGVGCGGDCGCSGTCTDAPTPSYKPDADGTVNSPPILPPWTTIDLGFSF